MDEKSSFSIIQKEPLRNLARKWTPIQNTEQSGSNGEFADDLKEHRQRSMLEELRWLFKPSCPSVQIDDCPMSCCIFWCLLLKSSKKSQRGGITLTGTAPLGSDMSLVHERYSEHEKSTASMRSEGQATLSTDDEETSTRVSSQTNLSQLNCGQHCTDMYNPHAPRESMLNLQVDSMHDECELKYPNGTTV